MPTKRTANVRTDRSPRLLFTLQTACEASGLPSRRRLRSWAAAALRRKSARVTVRIVGSREGRQLNKQFRGKDYATNVLTFVYDDTPLTGDIALCAPVVAREAREQRKSLAAHYAHLLIHGMLHLQGDDHVDPKEAQAMESREIALLRKFGFADPYAVTA